MYGSLNRRGHRRLAADEMQGAAGKARWSSVGRSVGFEGLESRTKDLQSIMQLHGISDGAVGSAFSFGGRRSLRFAIQGLLHACRLFGVERAEQIADEVVLHGQHRFGRKAEVRSCFNACDIRCLLKYVSVSSRGRYVPRRHVPHWAVHDSLSLTRAECRRLLTVPTGIPSASAASRYFNPWWYTSRSVALS